MWDVLVVGAGPGGCQAAWHLHKAGRRVLLVDKHDFPRHKSCGGMLSAAAANMLPFNVMRVARGVSRCLLQRHPDARYTVARNTAVLTDRAELDHHFWRFVQDEGVAFRRIPSITRVKARATHCDLFLANGEFVRASHVVAADGANSPLRHLLCPADEPVLAMALEADLPVPADAGTCPVGFDFSAVADGYAWYFPKRDRLNVGLYSSGSGKLDRRLFADIVARFGPQASAARVHGAPLALFDGQPRLAAGRVLFVGDAASLVDPFSGEGIREALESGRACAQALVESTDDPVAAYGQRLAPMLSMLDRRRQVAANRYAGHAGGESPEVFDGA